MISSTPDLFRITAILTLHHKFLSGVKHLEEIKNAIQNVADCADWEMPSVNQIEVNLPSLFGYSCSTFSGALS